MIRQIHRPERNYRLSALRSPTRPDDHYNRPDQTAQRTVPSPTNTLLK